jgi:hypothetical protein
MQISSSSPLPTERRQPSLLLSSGSQHCAAICRSWALVVAASRMQVEAGSAYAPPSSTSTGTQAVGDATGDALGDALGGVVLPTAAVGDALGDAEVGAAVVGDIVGQSGVGAAVDGGPVHCLVVHTVIWLYWQP